MKYELASSSWDQKEYDALNAVIARGHFSMGEEVAKAERKFAEFFGSKYCVMTSSGSTANLLAIAALFYRQKNCLKAKDEIIVPAVSWSTSYFPLLQYGLHLKFVDIDLETLNYDLFALKNAINKNTKAILAVNLLGNVNDFNVIFKEIESAKQKFGNEIILIEDNCESMGAELSLDSIESKNKKPAPLAKFGGKMAGTFGLLGTFSSFFSHHISTMEGGFIVGDDEELYHILLALRAHGWTRNLPAQNQICEKNEDDFYESFRFILPGYNVRPLEMSGALAQTQLEKLPDFLAKRRENAKYFAACFENSEDFLIQKQTPSSHSSYFGFSLVIKPQSKFKRAEVIKKLKAAQIDCRPIVAGNFTQNPVIKYFDYEIFGELKNAQNIHKNGFFVGNHHYNLKEQIDYLCEVLG